MTILPRWWKRPPILAANSNGPWGGGSDDGDANGGGGPRNPWATPPGGRRGQPQGPSALDEFLRKARGGGSGGGGGGGFGLPGGGPNARTLWIIGTALLVGLWIVFTSFHQIGPQERGVVSYFGRYTGTLTPGIQVTAPAPIATVQQFDVNVVRTENFPRGDGVNLVLTGDQNLVDLTYSVQWTIADAKDYAFQLAQPEETVRAAAESAMRAVIANTRLEEALGAGRTTIETRVADVTQQILNSYRAGIRIQGVSVNRAVPPSAIVEAFNKVTTAQQESVAAVNRARSYAQQVVARAQGEAAAFDRVYAEYRLAPEVTRRRMYYDTMEAVLAKSDKTIVEAPGVVPYLPLDRARRVPVPEATQGQAGAQPATQQGGGQ